MFPLIIYFYGVIVLVGAGAATVLWRKSQDVRQEPLNLRLLLIRVPRNESEDNKKEEVVKEIAKTEQLIASLAGLKEPFTLEVAVHNKGQDILFYAALPETHLDFFARQVQGIFLDAQVERVSDYTIFSPGSRMAGATLALKQSYILPIRTYRESESDSFAPIISSFTKLAADGEGAALQLVALPAPDGIKKGVVSSIQSLRKGAKLTDVLNDKFFDTKELAKFGKDFIFANSAEEKKEEFKTPIVDDDALKALQQKVAKPLFSVNVRMVTAATSSDRAEDMLLAFASSFSQFGAPQRNSFAWHKPASLKAFAYDYIFRTFNANKSMFLNTEELASIFHLPTQSSAVPYLKWLKHKEAPPPEVLPAEGIILGESVFRGEHKPVRLTDADRNRHLYVIGQTGTGKTAILASMAAQDIVQGRGVCIIDPNTDFFNSMIALVPKERIEDVVIFDPSDLTRPVGLNMLEFDTNHPEQRSFVINEMLVIFDKLYDLKTTGGPMFELYLRNALLLLTEDFANEPATLMEVQRLFTDDVFRTRKLENCKDPLVSAFWQNAQKRTGEGSLANMTTYITSKFTQFVNNDYMRPIIGQPKSAFNFRDIMDQGKILFVNLPKGVIGDLNANLLGMIIVGKLMMAAFSRVDIEERERKNFYLYMDEFQNFTTETIATILSEARKYKLNLHVAHQFVAQLNEKIRDAIFGNVGNMIAFRVGAPDTEVLGKQFEPVFSPRDLISIDNLNAHAKILVNGEPTRPFNLKVIFAPRGSVEVREKLKELSRLVHGADRADIEADIFSRLKA